MKFLERGQNYISSGDNENGNSYYSLALEDFQKAFDMDPNNGDALFYIGLIQFNNKDDIAAYYTLEKAEKLGSSKATHFIKKWNLR